MPTLYRITSRRHRPTEPAGALKTPGRWHNLNQAVLYFSSSLSLAVLELRARGVTFDEIRSSFHYISTELLDANLIESVPARFFTGDWSARIQDSRKLGARWFEKEAALALQVRSAALHTEANFLVNVNHPDFGALRFSQPQPVPLDERL